MTRLIGLMLMFVLASLSIASTAQSAYRWEAFSGLFPDQIPCPWELVDTAPGAPSLSAGVLTVTTTLDDHTLGYQLRSPAIASLPETTVVEFRGRLVSNTSTFLSRTSMMVSFYTRPDAVALFAIGNGEIFLNTTGDVKGPVAAVPTDDVMHTYRIVLKGKTAGSPVEVYYDGELKLTGAVYTLSNAASPAIAWGDLTIKARGTSEWEFFEHNVAVPCDVPESPPTFVRSWGSFGGGNGQFNNPTAMALDGGGNLYVLDAGNYRIQKFGPDGTYLTQWGGYGSGDGQFNEPAGIVVDDKNAGIWVYDAGRTDVQRFDLSGAFDIKVGGYGSDDGEILYAANNYNSAKSNTASQRSASAGIMAVDSLGNLYFADAGNHRIQKFDKFGSFVTKWGTCGSGPGEFNQPAGIVVDDKNAGIYVMDRNPQIQKFNLEGVFVTKWGVCGTGPGEFNQPAGIVVDDKNAGIVDIFVADGGDRIQKFNQDGDFLTTFGSHGPGQGELRTGDPIPGFEWWPEQIPGGIWVSDRLNDRFVKFGENGAYLTQFGSRGSGPGQFNRPLGMVIAQPAAGVANYYVLDARNHRIQQFSRPVTVAVSDPRSSSPSLDRLSLSALPNPSSGQTQIAFTLPASGPATIAIYDVVGRRLRQWEWSTLPAGQHQLEWNGMAEDGHLVPPSVLFYRLNAGGQMLKQTIVRVR